MFRSILILELFSSTQTFAGGSSIGPSLCQEQGYALCRSAAMLENPLAQGVWACPAEGSTMAGITDADGSMSDYNFPTQKVDVPKGTAGAGLRFRGMQLNLEINTDVPQGDKGFPAILSIESLGVFDQTVWCTLNTPHTGGPQ